MRLQEYMNESILMEMTYEEYCANVDYVFTMDEGVFQSIGDALSSIKLRVVAEWRTEIEKIKTEIGLEWAHIVKAFKNKEVFNFLRVIGFGLGTLLKGLNALSKIFYSGLHQAFVEISKNKYVQKIQSGAMKVDELLEKHPILKKLAGPVMAAFLFWAWLNMTYIGHLDYDFDLSHISAALKGQYSVAVLFTSPEGLLFLTLLGTGSLISMPWLGHAVFNVLLGLIYTGVKKAGDTATARKIKEHLVLKPI